MTQGIRIGTAIKFVRDIDRSVSFYCDVLALHVTDRDDSSSVALLASAYGAALILRAMGDRRPIPAVRSASSAAPH